MQTMRAFDKVRLFCPSHDLLNVLELVLMNLIGNAVKFTGSGSVKVLCFLDSMSSSSPGEVPLKFEIQYCSIPLWQLLRLKLDQQRHRNWPFRY